MTEEQRFVALKAFRFGATDLQLGDLVPVEAGRDYRLMQRLGQIGPASVTAPAGTQEEPLLTPYEGGSTVVFVADEGGHTLVKFLDALEAPDEVRDAMGLDIGEVVASVVFPDDPDNATFVSMASLLPEQPTARLLAAQQAQWEAHDELSQTASRQHDKASQLTQEALASGQALAEQLAEVRAELETRRAVPVIPPDALQRLVDVKGVGEKLAPVILAALTAQPEPPTPEG